MFRPTLCEVIQLSQNYKKVPICYEITSDFITPIEVLKKIKNKSKHCFILESVEKQEKWGRYTFLGYDPVMEITCKDNIISVKDLNYNQSQKEYQKIIKTNDPSNYIKKILEENKSPKIDKMPTFTGGLVGYFSYDYIKYSEKTLKLDAKDEEGFKDADLMMFDKIIVFDNVCQKLLFIVNINLDTTFDNETDTEKKETYIKNEYKKAQETIKKMEYLVTNKEDIKDDYGEMTSEYTTLFNKEEFCNMVKEAKKYIYEGDIFQVVLSNRVKVDYKGSLINIYRALRMSNPSPYMFYFSSDDMEVAGASPETLVKAENKTVRTYPLAGTRIRGRNKEEDMLLEHELLNDEKELAEHNMLVDLGRNDLGKISKFGSVEVDKYMEIERFSCVMHIGSTLKGTMQENKTAMDAIDAVLPAGTLSGAPKIRACEIINKLENNKRGIYGGAVGYLDFTGNMDTGIAIRLAYKKNGKVFIRSGAGIVADSIPEKEYDECINKAKAVINALSLAQEEFKTKK